MIKEISNECIKCGKCIQVCTIYNINRNETTSPRGFLDLLGAYKDGNLVLDKNLKSEILNLIKSLKPKDIK